MQDERTSIQRDDKQTVRLAISLAIRLGHRMRNRCAFLFWPRTGARLVAYMAGAASSACARAACQQTRRVCGRFRGLLAGWIHLVDLSPSSPRAAFDSLRSLRRPAINFLRTWCAAYAYVPAPWLPVACSSFIPSRVGRL